MHCVDAGPADQRSALVGQGGLCPQFRPYPDAGLRILQPWFHVTKADIAFTESSLTGKAKVFFRSTSKTDSERSAAALHIYLADLVGLNGYASFPWCAKS